MKQEIIAQTTELPEGKKMKVTVGNREILLINIGGAYFAVDNKCTHMGGSLYEGNLEGYNVVCPRHGTAFDVRTGAVSQTGKMAFIKISPKDLHNYPLKIEGTNILIEID